MDQLERGRESYGRRAWLDAYESLTQADKAEPLRAVDLELMATSAYLVGHYDENLAALERAHHKYLDAGEPLRAAHCAIWIGFSLLLQEEMGRGTGWVGRAQRLVERDGRDCVERGYLLLTATFEHEGNGDWEAAEATAAEATEIAERFGDRDLFGLAVHEQGHIRVKLGRVADGLALLDEAMVAVTAGELSPIVSGIVYCGVLLGCEDAYELRRAREWTAALTQWCDEQPEMVPFTGRCLIHRALVLQLNGAWSHALEEARLAGSRFAEGENRQAVGEAHYLEGEVYRLRGAFAAAEEAYREASRCGCEPQPGLALLRLAQGKGPAAEAAIRRIVGETTDRPKLARLLPAYVEIMVAVGALEEARSACQELGEIESDYESGMLAAMVAHARGAVDLADGDSRAALLALREASRVWQELGVPYEAARVRVLLGLACRALGDHDAASLELAAARGIFAQLEATPELRRVDSLIDGTAATAETHGLTPRELEVLRMVAAGKTNKAIAAELVLSERTVDRHVSNIFAKLRVSSRAAATAHAYEHELI